MKLKCLTSMTEPRIRTARFPVWLLIAAFSCSAQAADYTYTSDGSEITITGYTGSGGAVAIPSMIENLPVTSIGYNAFYVKTSVTSVVIPDSVKTIGIQAFAYCSGLVSANIPNSVTNIGWSAFNNCSALESISIPQSVATIGEYAFSYCSSMTSITVAEANTAYSSNGGILFNKEQTVLLQCPGAKAGTYTLPDSVTHVWNHSFRNCVNLTSVAIGDNVTIIGGFAFSGCSSLTTAMIGSGVTNILDYAFNACTSLTGLYFKGDAPSLGGYLVFLDAENMTVYYLPETTGWGATFGDRPTAVWVPSNPITIIEANISGNQLRFTITGTADSAVLVETCTDLANPDWTVAETITLTDGSGAFTDPDPATLPGRYYRVRTQ